MFNRPWLLIPVPVEWKREGDTTTVTRVQRYHVDIHGAHSLENLPLGFFELMKDYDEAEAAAQEAAMEAAKQDG